MIDHARDAARAAIDLAERAEVEDELVALDALHAMVHVLDGIFLRERRQREAHGDALREARRAAQRAFQPRLPREDERQERLSALLEVQEEPQLLVGAVVFDRVRGSASALS